MGNKIPSFDEFVKLNEYKKEDTNNEKDNPEDKPTTEYPDFMTKEDIEFCEKAKRGEIIFKEYDDPHQPIIYI